ncbi:MAG: BatA and WFA domain-containing protein [Bacteroidales bacterium]|nr:BatA and WFA domain-containing protein [Bacteroidales bacterium]
MLTVPLFLIGLIAVGIPIAIHLLQLRRYRKVYFSNVDMLEELQSENRKQNNLRRRLILAARILAIVFIVLAFCQPVIPNKSADMKAGGTVVSVYIDNSFSMECGGMDGSLMESAKSKAREIVEAYRPDDQFQLLTCNADGSQFHWLSREDFLNAVDQLQVTSATTSLSAIMERQYQFLHNANAANRHAYVVSDFQRSTADLHNLVADTAIQATFIPLGGTQEDNLYVDSVSFDAPSYFVGAAVKVHVSVTNRGAKSVERLPLRLFVDDKQCALTSVDVPAHGSAQADMTFTIQKAGSIQGYVETTDYPITFDDRLYFTLSVDQQMPMLVVSGGGENVFLRRLFAADSLVGYHQTAFSQVDYSHISDYRFIVLDELHALSSGLSQMLQEFLSQGGTALLVPAADAEVVSYNQFLASVQAPQLGGWVKQSSRAANVQFDHSLYRGVFQRKNEEMEMPVVNGHYRVEMTSATVSQPIITLLDGTQYLVSLPVGEGRLYVVASPLRSEYTDFVNQALFVPSIYNMALFSNSVLPPYSSISSVSPIPIAGSYGGDEVEHLRNQDGTFDIIPDIRRNGNGRYLLLHGEVTEAGNYVFSPSGQGITFNYSRQESDLDFLSRDELQRAMRSQGLDHCQVVPSAAKNMTEYIRRHNQGTPLWRWCLVLALLSLLAEIVLIRFKK